jgi:hypothetical protein
MIGKTNLTPTPLDRITRITTEMRALRARRPRSPISCAVRRDGALPEVVHMYAYQGTRQNWVCAARHLLGRTELLQ